MSKLTRTCTFSYYGILTLMIITGNRIQLLSLLLEFKDKLLSFQIIPTWTMTLRRRRADSTTLSRCSSIGYRQPRPTWPRTSRCWATSTRSTFSLRNTRWLQANNGSTLVTNTFKRMAQTQLGLRPWNILNGALDVYSVLVCSQPWVSTCQRGFLKIVDMKLIRV